VNIIIGIFTYFCNAAGFASVSGTDLEWRTAAAAATERTSVVVIHIDLFRSSARGAPQRHTRINKLKMRDVSENISSAP